MQTNRLLLRPFLVSDAPELYRLNGSPAVMRYLPKDEVFTDLMETRKFAHRYIEASRRLPYCRWAVVRKADGRWLGWCGLKLHRSGETDLGFRFHERYWGKGYATEAGRAWLAWGFEQGMLRRIVAQAAAGNSGSQRVLLKLGFNRAPEEDYDEDGFRWLRFEIEPGNLAP